MNERECTIDAYHCENCGQVNPNTDDGYTTCCNELPTDKLDCRNHHGDRRGNGTPNANW